MLEYERIFLSTISILNQMINIGLIFLGVLAIAAIFVGIYIYNKKKTPSTKKVDNGHFPTPSLDLYSRDITQLAREGRVDPVIGREDEIYHTIQILTRRTKNNPILLGEPGVGKTAIVEGLARKIAAGNIPEILKRKRVISLDLSGLLAGTKYRGEFEKRMKTIMDEIRNAKRTIILFIDEVHVITESKGAEGAISASNMLKPALSRGDLQAIGATTPNEYNEYIKTDASLERRFQPVQISEPSVDMTIEILKGLKKTYENHHRVIISDDALHAAAVLSKKYIKDRYLPDKAIDLIDEGSAKVRLLTSSAPEKIVALKKDLDKLEKQYQTEDPSNQLNIGTKITNLKERISLLERIYDDDTNREKLPLVSVNDIKEIISGWIGTKIEDIVLK